MYFYKLYEVKKYQIYDTEINEFSYDLNTLLFNYTYTLSISHKFEDLENIYQELIASSSDSPEVWLNRGSFYLHIGELDNASRDFQKSLKLLLKVFPAMKKINEMKKEIYENTKRAIEYVQSGISDDFILFPAFKLDTRNVNLNRTICILHKHIAQINIQKNRLIEALMNLNLIIHFDIDFNEINLLFAKVYFKLEFFGKVIRHYEIYSEIEELNLFDLTTM